MKQLTTLLFLTCLSFSVLEAQEAKENVSPISFDKSVLSGVGLEKIDLKDEPEKDFYQKRLYWGKELGVFVVGTETWTNTITNYPFDEFIYMYNGEALVKPMVGNSQIFYSGEYFFAPKGFQGEWEVKGNNQIHYELSVITTVRADSSKVIKNSSHKRFKKSILSGNSIHLNQDGFYEEVLEKGAELTIKLIGEKLGERPIRTTEKEQMIHILAGQVNITNVGAEQFTYYAGDFFLIPRGLSGTWKNDGHNLVKYLSVEQTSANATL
ncbi:cupin domain-containing protein [Maribacter algarum]|nr:cupin domain-containing protein [Maribacter algarum]